MNAPHRLSMDPDAFLDWEVRQSRKHELVDGVVRLMAGATRAHLRIQANITALLNAQLRGKQCEALQELKVVIPNKNYRYADVAVDCGALKPRDLVAAAPRVLFEVESPSTGFLEEMDRLSDYQSVVTVQHIIVLAQDRAKARVWTRQGDGWAIADCEGLEGALNLDDLAIALAMAEIYDGVTFEAPTQE